MKRTRITILISFLAVVLPVAAASQEGAGGCFSRADESLRKDIFILVNRERAENGLFPLDCDPALSAIAQNHAEDMSHRGYFSHTAPGGIGMKERLAAGGVTYHLAGENIAWGYRDAGALVRGWMHSAGHRKNILGDFTRVGVGSYRGYSVLLFIRE